MAQWLRIFVEIAIWRRGPQDLPASATLLWLVSLAYAGVTAIQAGIRGWDLRSGVLLLAIDWLMQALWLWLVLALFSRRARFVQTFTAFLGINALLTLLDALITALLGLMGIAATSQANPWPFVSLAIMLMSLGRVLQLALERSLFLGMALVLVILLTIAYVAQGLLPGM